MVVATDRYVAEDACQRIRVDYEQLPAVVGIEAARDGAAPRARGRARQRRGPHGAGGRRRRGRPGRRAAHARPSTSTIERSACMPMEGKGVYARWDAERRRAAHLLLHPDVDRRAGRRRRQARPAAGQGRVHRPRRGRRLRRQDHAPVARGGPGAVGGPAARRRGQVDRGPPRALHLLRARARPAAGGDGRLRRRGPAARASTCRFWHDNGAYTPYGIIVPIITSTQLLGPYKPGAYRVRVLVALHQHRPRHALPRRRPAAGRASRWSGRWTPSPTTSASTAPRCARATSSSPSEMPYDHGLLFQDGRPLKYDSRRLPGLPRQAQEAGRLGRLRGLPRRRPRPRAARSGSASAATSRAPASAPTRAATSRSRPAGGSTSRPA